MNKRLLSIFCVLVLLVSLTPVSAAFDLSYSSTPPLATLQMDGETTDYYSDLSGHQSDQDILLDLFQRTKGRTAQITLHKEVKVNTSLVIDDPDTCLTLELDSYGVDLYCTNHSVPLFKVTAGSLTLKGNGEFGASQGVYISGDNAKVVLNGTSIMPYADGTSTVGVGLYGSGSLQIINSHIGNLAIKENYQTGVLIQGGSASECSAVIDLSKNFAISGHTGISVEHGGSLVIKGNGRIVSNTQISNGIALKADQHSSVTLSGGRYMSTGTNGIAIKSEYPIGKMLVDGYAFYDYSSGMPLKDINVNDTSSSNSNDLLVKTVDENGPVAMVTTANGHMEQFFSSEYEGSDSAALTAAWEYADNGGASRLTLQRSIEYNASSPLQLNYNSDLTINIPDGITLTGAARSSELIQVTSGRLNIGNGTIVSKGGQTAIRVVAGELNISGGSITTDCSGYSSIASTIEANSLASVNISGGEISLTNSERTESVCLAADAGSRVTLSGGAFTSNQAAIEADDTVASLLAPGYYFYLETDDGTKFVDLNGHELILGEGGGRYVVELGNAGELVATVVTDDVSKEEFTLGESGTEADALARAIAYAEGKTSTLTVHRGVELSRALELYSGSTKLELCMDSGAYISLDNAQDGVIRVLDGELELASGSIRTSGEKAIGLYMNGSCRVTVSGGEVNAGTASGSSAVRLGDDAELVVTGGKLLGQRGVYLERSTYPGALLLSGSADVYGSDCGVYAEGGYIGFSDGLVSSGHIGIYLTEEAGLDMNGDASIAVNGSGNTVGVQLEYGVIANIGGSASIVAHTSGSGASHGIDQAAGTLSVSGNANIRASSYSSTAYAAFLTGGTAAISGGSFTGTTTNSGTGHGLGVGLNESTVELSGGSFTSTEDGKAVLAFADGDNVGRLLKSDYSYYDSQNNRVENPGELQSLSGSTSYTVKPAEASGDLVATLEINGKTTKYALSDAGDTVESLFTAALANANGKTATLTLMKSAAPDSTVTINAGTNLTLVMPEDVRLTANVVVEGTLGLVGGKIYSEYDQFTSAGTSVVTVRSGGCLNVLSGQIDYLLSERASGSEFSAVSVEAGGTVNISGGVIGYEVYGPVTGKSPSALTISGGAVNMRGGKVSAVNNSSAASNNTAYAIKLTDGEFNMTSGMVQAEDGGYEGNSMTALSVQDGKADLSGGSIESNAQGIHMAGGSAYIGGSAELRADNGAGVLVSDGSLEVYGNAFIQGSTSGVELKNSATGTYGSANIYGNAKITGGDYGMYVDSHSTATVNDMPVFTGNAGLYVETIREKNVNLYGGCYIGADAESGSVRVWEEYRNHDIDDWNYYDVSSLLATNYQFYNSQGGHAMNLTVRIGEQICTVKSENASSELEGEVSISGNLTYGETLTAEITGLSPKTAVLTYKWYRCDDGRGSGAALVGSDATYKLTAADIGKYISVTVTTADLSGSLKDITAAAVEKADNPKKPTDLTAVDGTGVKDGKITGVTSAMEYADNANFAGAKSCTGSEITGLAGGEYYVRCKETATHKAGPAVAIFVGTKTTIETLKVNGVTIVEVYEYNQSASVENLSFDPVNSILTAYEAEINAEQFELTGSVTLRFTGTQNKITGLSENIVPGGELTIQGTGSLTLERDAGSLVYETVGELTVGGRAYRFYGSVNGGWAGIVYEGNKGTVNGNYALCSAAATINAGDTLTIPEGAVLTNNITLTNNGTLIIEDMDSIAGSGSIVGGTNIILDPGAAMLEISTPDNAVFDGSTDYAQQVSLGLKDKIVIQGAEFSFDASAWTRRITRNGEVVSSAVSDGVYIVTYSRDGATIGPVSFSVTRIELPDTITYPIEVVSTEHGSVSASVNWAEAGSKVTLTVTPDDGWKLDSLSATDAKGGKLSLTDLGGGKYAFTMPSAKVTVKAVFTSGAALVFSDVPAGSWYYDAVAYVSENGLMNGVDAGTFDPNGTLTRAMVWTILARLEGADTEGGASWYAKAQAWAMESGVSDGEDPMGAITREQLVTMLWRYSGAPGVELLLTAPDAGKISSWAMDAMRWAVSEGIIDGDETGAVNPTGSATRAEAAAIFMRFAEGLEK